MTGARVVGALWRRLLAGARRRLLAVPFALLLATLVGAHSSMVAAQLSSLIGEGVDLKALADAITELDVSRARELAQRYQRMSLSVEQSEMLGIERARLALYVGDCDAAEAILDALSPDSEAVSSLSGVARRCAGAVAASRIVEDRERGIWLRLQDAEDEPIVPYVAEVAARALAAVRKDLGVALPRPLRIDVVRDLFSLSAVSGLPLESAETTGTVAVARWGRVTLLSPRAARHGYPWEDTMAHEIVHLALSRATRDFAPLWLQEGVAKRQEVRWRPPRPFDDPEGHHLLARRALDGGHSVGVQNLGPSIAMLPSADAASIAFSEVTSFVSYWIDRNGTAAFKLLLADLKGLADRDPSAALRSVSGYDLDAWEARWQAQLRSLDLPPDTVATFDAAAEGEAMMAAGQQARLGDLMLVGQNFASARDHFRRAAAATPRVAAMRYRAGLGAIAAGVEGELSDAIGGRDDLDGAHAGWLALDARRARAVGEREVAELSSRMAVGMDPWAEIVACEGRAAALLGAAPRRLFEPPDATRKRLCDGARARPPVQ